MLNCLNDLGLKQTEVTLAKLAIEERIWKIKDGNKHVFVAKLQSVYAKLGILKADQLAYEARYGGLETMTVKQIENLIHSIGGSNDFS